MHINAGGDATPLNSQGTVGPAVSQGLALGSLLNLEECQLPTQISCPCPALVLPLKGLSALMLLKTKSALCCKTISFYNSL